MVTWQIKDVISPLSHGLWTPNLAGWWLRMRGPHTQSHVTFWCHGHETNKKRYISIFTRSMYPKLSRVVTYDEGTPPTSHVTHEHVVTWQIKEVIFPLSQGLWTPSLAEWWLRMREPHPQVTWHINHVVTWQIKDVKSPLSQALWNPNLPEWWRRVKGPHLQSHLTDGSSGHVTNQKYFTFSQGPRPTTLAGW